MGFGDLLKKASQKANELVKTGAEVLEDVKQSAVRGIESASEVIKERVEIHEAEAEERRKQREAAEAEKKEKQELVKRLTGTLKGHIRIETEKERKKTEEEANRRQEIEKAEKEKKEQEAAEEAERKEKDRAERISKALEPSCEKGDCLWNNGKFYYICDECVECNRKRSTKNMQGKVKYPQLWKYMKRYEQQEKVNEEYREFESFREEVKAILTQYGDNWNALYLNPESYYRMKYDYDITLYYNTSTKKIINSINNLRNTEDEIKSRMDFIGDELVDKYMPKFSYSNSVRAFMTYRGIDNAFFDLVWDLKDLEVYIPENLLELLKNEELEFSDEEIHPLELEREFYRNPSLYKRNKDDFVYTIENLLITAKEDENTYKKLFDEEGNILPAGIGGPQEGFYDPCIWNVIHNNL